VRKDVLSGMLKPHEKLKEICSERDGLRNELVEMEKAMHKTVFVFFTVCVAFIGIYLDEKIISNPEARRLLLLALTQIEFFSWLFLISLMSNQNVHVGYIRALEKQINTLNGNPISVWDSRISRKFIGSPRGVFFWASTLLAIFSIAIFVLCLVIVLKETKIYWITIIFSIELAVTLSLLIWALLEINSVERYSIRSLSSGTDKSDKANQTNAVDR